MTYPYQNDPIARSVSAAVLMLMAGLVIAGVMPSVPTKAAPIMIVATPTLGIAWQPTIPPTAAPAPPTAVPTAPTEPPTIAPAVDAAPVVEEAPAVEAPPIVEAP